MERTQDLVSWSREDARLFGQRPLLARHRLHELELFSDSCLLDLIDTYPRERLQVFVSGRDPLHFDDWRLVAATTSSGRELLAAIATGSLWLNLQRIELVDRRFRDLVDRLYETLAEQCPQFAPLWSQASLFISSPHALVYYHVDPHPNMLWHIRGVKHMWLYPDNDARFISQEVLEDIFAGKVDEIQFAPEFDRHAVRFELAPGDVLSWPQNAPHRITNQATVNISLSTVHGTATSERRRLIYLANQFFRRTWRLPARSTRETGGLAAFKCLAYRVSRRANLAPSQPTQVSAAYADRGRSTATLRVDPAAARGVSPL